MAGHSKWANIKFRKAAQDAKRGKTFTKLIREISVSARLGGVHPESNPRLRSAMDKALAANMTRDTIERAIKRGGGDADSAAIEEIRYEGYAAGGVAVLVECASDNKNRTVSAVRHAFSKHGGNLGTDGSVAYLFRKVGSFIFANGEDEEHVMEIALQAGADDLQSGEADGMRMIEVTSSAENFHQVELALRAADLKPSESGLVQRALNEVPVADEAAEKIMQLTDALLDLDDVQNVFTNAAGGAN